MRNELLARLVGAANDGSLLTEELVGNGRGIGLTDVLHGHAPWSVIVLFALITQLGHVWFLFLLGGVLYVAGEDVPRLRIDRHRGMFVFALVMMYLALIPLLKEASSEVLHQFPAVFRTQTSHRSGERGRCGLPPEQFGRRGIPHGRDVEADVYVLKPGVLNDCMEVLHGDVSEDRPDSIS